MGVTLAGGQDQWKGKIVRIAHLGYIDSFDIIIAISALEMSQKKWATMWFWGKGSPQNKFSLTVIDFKPS